MEKKTLKLTAALLVLVAAIAAAMGVLVYRQHLALKQAESEAERAADPYIREDGVYDLREADLEDARLFGFTGAVSVDLSGREIEPGVYEAVRKNNPEAVILWDVPFGGARIPNTAEELAVTEFDEETERLLGYFPALKTLDGSACAEYAALCEYQRKHPEQHVLYTVPVFGKKVASGETWLALSDLPEDMFHEDELLEKLALLPDVTDIDLVGVPLTDETKTALKTARPDIRWYWFVDVAGKRFRSTDTHLDFTDVDFDSFEQLPGAVRLFNAPALVDVATQGFENVQMERVQKEFPDTVFAWTLRIGKYNVRTDVTVLDLGFEAGDRALRNDDIKQLKYCTQLEALSLNSQSISDLSPIAGLKKLKILCLGANRISDIKPLSELTDLQYLNLASNSISDLKPLSKLSELTDLNLMDNRISDLSVVTELKKLKRVFVGKNDATPGEINRVAEAVGSYAELNDSAKANWKKSASCEVVDDIFTSRVMRKLYETP